MNSTNKLETGTLGIGHSPNMFAQIGGWLWNPFVTTAGGPALFIGLIIILATSAIGSVSNSHFNGVLDVHSGREAPLLFFLWEGIVNWIALAAVLWVAGVIITPKGQKFRAIDLFGTQALARWPFLLVALLSLLPGFGRYSSALNSALQSAPLGQFSRPDLPATDVLTYYGVVVASIVIIIWFIALAWKSFRICCDLKGGKSVVAFIVAVIIGEVLSKIVIGVSFAITLKNVG